jgi:hypothetical protein
MNSIDIANQLRATVTVHFSRNKKEFFPGMFWAIDMILTNYWKIYKSLYGPFILPTGKKQPTVHRTFLEALVELLFLCDSEKYAENVSGTSFKKYPKYSYIPHKTGQKPKETPLDFRNLSRKTSLVFKRDSGRPRMSIPEKTTSLSQHQHIKTTTSGHCLICRNSREIQNTQIAKTESIVYGTILKLSEGVLKEVSPLSKEEKKGPKRIRGTITKWKCSECTVPICKARSDCWKRAHRRLFNK